jgi:hypothetical protein
VVADLQNVCPQPLAIALEQEAFFLDFRVPDYHHLDVVAYNFSDLLDI